MLLELFPARYLRAIWYRPQGLRSDQPLTALCTYYRLGTGRVAGLDGGSRYQLLTSLSQTGALLELGYRDQSSRPPLNLVADFGHGSMLMLLGIVFALYERERSGKGKIVDAAMVDGISVLAQMMWTMKSTGALRDERELFLIDGGIFCRCYETADGKHMSVGAINPQFFAALLTGLGLLAKEVSSQLDIALYPLDARDLRAAVRQSDPRTVNTGFLPASMYSSPRC
ncbi:CoA transferase [Mycobacterium uberis]|uniref:CoA transferase n=1 Tax=Mycobacterium uberis TaxID=2162698 RepID=UPI000E30719A|nr:CoA transferase [Mycobacterium uberis]